MVVIAQTRGGEYLRVTSRVLHTIVKAGTIPADFDCLHPFKRAKDFETTTEFTNYQHQYVLDDTGGGIGTGVTYRRVAAKLAGKSQGQHGDSSDPLARAGGSGRRYNLLLSKNTRINTEALATVTSVVIAIERTKHCRVLRLNTEFVLDENDKLWLAGATLCNVAARPAATDSREDSSDQQGRWSVGQGKHTLATELRSRKHETDHTSGVLSDEKFSQLLRRVGYRSPMKSRAVSSSRRHHACAKLNPTNRNVTTTQDRNGKIREKVIDDLADLSEEVTSNTGRGQQGVGSREPFDSETDFLNWTASDSTEGMDTSHLDEDVDGGSSCSIGRSPSPSRPALTEGLNSSVVKLDQAATNRIFGSTQVRTSFDVRHVSIRENRNAVLAALGGLPGIFSFKLRKRRMHIFSDAPFIHGGKYTEEPCCTGSELLGLYTASWKVCRRTQNL